MIRYKFWGCVFVFLCFFSGAYGQQMYVISGQVTDISNGDPIVGATIMLADSAVGAITDAEGNYRFQARLTPKKSYQLVSRFLGYVSGKTKIYARNKSEIIKNVKMITDLLGLEEVVVTGTSVETSRKQLGNAISVVKAETLSEGASLSADQALAGKVAGALVQQNSGDPAGGISIRLRGASTISGSSDPLYIVDGVIVNNASNQLIDLGGGTQNRLIDINPADIARIEVIKGASVAAIYGSRASNGVVQIFTKRGKQGKPKINFSTSVRINRLRKKVAYNQVPLAWENINKNNTKTVPVTRYDYQDEFFRTSTGTENNLSVTGGNSKTKYFVSGSYLHNGGIIKNTHFRRFGGRMNLDQALNNWLSFSYGLSYTQSSSKDIPNGGINSAYGALTGFIFSDNKINPQADEAGDYPVTSPLVPRTNPLEAVNRFKFGQHTHRTISNLNLTATPLQNLTLTYRFGLDYYNQSGKGFIPLNNTSPSKTGFATRSDANVTQFNSDLNANHTLALSDELQLISTAGITWQQQKYARIGLTADRLAPMVETPVGGTLIGQTDYRSAVSYWGAFLQGTLNFKEKMFLTTALRTDGASVFGPGKRTQLYAKASGSYLISAEDFWDDFRTAVSNLKIRFSWGQAGNLTALGPFDRFLNYNPISFNGTSGLQPSTLLGNKDLAPERMTEIEAGFDASFLNDRVGLEFSYYRQKVEDLLLKREVAASTGFTTRYENVGALQNSGIELRLHATPIRKKNFNWHIIATYSANKNKVTRVVGDRITLPGSFSSSYVIPGESLGVFYRQYYARNEKGQLLLDDKGYPMRATNDAGAVQRKVLGDPNPDWIGALTNELHYKNLSFRIQLDAVQGFQVFNWNRRLMDNYIFGGGENVGRELRGELPKGYGSAQAKIFEEFVENGSFVKLRELSLSYRWENPIPEINRITFSLSGRNLLSFDKYSGWDPEVNTPGQSNGVRGFDFAAVPIPQTIQLGVNLNF